MPFVKSFKDRNGKQGSVGSIVYHWMHDIGEPSKNKNTKTVENIATFGAGGTKIKFKGENGYTPAKNYIIVSK